MSNAMKGLIVLNGLSNVLISITILHDDYMIYSHISSDIPVQFQINL